MAILFIASEAAELKPFSNFLTGLRPLKWPLDYAQEGVLNDRRVLLAANGAGPKLAAQALEVAIRAITAAELQSSALEAVASVGYCGALDPSFEEGQILVASEVRSPAAENVYSAVEVECARPFTTGVFVSQDRVAGTSDEKTRLREKFSAIAVEMEAFGIAARAKRAALPFACIKVVSDRAGESFKIDLNESRSADGRISRGKIVFKAVSRPGLIPELVRLRRRADLAARALGDFLVSCRFNTQPADPVVSGDNQANAG